MNKKVLIANKSHSEIIENLRSLAYHNSKGFSVKDELELQNYCKWGDKDAAGIVLIVLNENDEALSCLRANVYLGPDIHIENTKVFTNCPDGFVKYPTLDMTFAATDPAHYGAGLMSLLRYYMYLLHKHSVESITGNVVKNSILHAQLTKLGYEFLETDFNRKDIKTVENWMLATLNKPNFDEALLSLKTKYTQLIADYPLVVN